MAGCGQAYLVWKRIAIVLCALAQIFPANVSFAAETGDVEIVICTAQGQLLVSWEELTGEPAPIKQSDQHQNAISCDACMGCCRYSASEAHLGSAYPHAMFTAQYFSLLQERPVIAVRAIGPPLPSRSPPISG